MAMYGLLSYWDERYRAWPQEELPYEWYQGYQSLRHLLNPIHFSTQTSNAISRPQTDSFARLAQTNAGFNGIAKPPPTFHNVHAFPSRDLAKVLILGCGHSRFGEDMQRDGWTGEIVNVDFSSVVIEQMKAKYSDTFYQQNAMFRVRPMQFICADMTAKLPFSDNYFDLIVCKGSLDAVLCSLGNKCSAARVVQECVRLLLPGHGIFFLVTHGNPDNRIELLEHKNSLEHYWHGVNVFHVNRPIPVGSNQMLRKTDYIYICRKRTGAHLGASHSDVSATVQTKIDYPPLPLPSSSGHVTAGAATVTALTKTINDTTVDQENVGVRVSP